MVSRRRSTPWIHRWSRVLIAGIAGLGALLTAYLTIVSFSGNAALCPISGCDQVLTSPYAKLFGLPLSLFGCLAYLGMGSMALAPLAINPDQNKRWRADLENWTWLVMFIGSTAMVLFSGYLMYLLTDKIKAVCLYCIASALFSATLFVLTLVGRAWEDVGQLVFTGVIVATITLIGTIGVYANLNQPPATASSHWTGPKITTTSGPAELALAEHLTNIGAKEYGMFNCGHCYAQKQLFGAEAVEKLNYIECSSQAVNSQAELCTKAGIEGTPTWEINGKKYPGTQPLEVLAELSGYTGSRNFKNQAVP
jgi:uncharacterized membrane protein